MSNGLFMLEAIMGHNHQILSSGQYWICLAEAVQLEVALVADLRLSRPQSSTVTRQRNIFICPQILLDSSLGG